jgi:hypothetical protein
MILHFANLKREALRLAQGMKSNNFITWSNASLYLIKFFGEIPIIL